MQTRSQPEAKERIFEIVIINAAWTSLPKKECIRRTQNWCLSSWPAAKKHNFVPLSARWEEFVDNEIP